MTDEKFRLAVFEDIKNAHGADSKKLDRDKIAETMSALTGERITKSMLYNWTGESHKKHNMPAKYIDAFARATGQTRTLCALIKGSGYEVVSGATKIRAEIEALKAEIKSRKQLLKEVDHV